MKKVALITGAARGIGRAVALALAERGWAVVINYRGNAKAAAETQSLIKKLKGESITIQADISATVERDKLVVQTLERFNRIDLLVNNAGMAPRQRKDMLETTEQSYDEVMSVNLKGPFFLTQIVANKMIEKVKAGASTSPKIINIGSISAVTSSTSRAEYCLSKAGVAMMTPLFADRLAEYGINVYEIRPGVIATDMTAVVKKKYDRLFAEGLAPIQRWGKPEEVAQAVIAAAEGYLPYSTGEVINVDGGMHLRRL